MKVVIVGATGYGGIELIRLCQQHPQLEIGALVSTSAVGQALGDVYPHLSHLEIEFSELTVERIAAAGEVVFFAAPAGVSSEWMPSLLKHGLLCIDLAGDFRFPDPQVYREWYGREAADAILLQQAVYGLSEWNREAIQSASLVANPGCYPTAALLGLLPLLKKRLIETQSVIIDAKSGVSGAGRSAKVPLLFAEVNENVRPYKVDGHQHIPEIELGCERYAEQALRVSFTPHIVPMSRGICCTMYAQLSSDAKTSEIAEAYHEQYDGEAFIRLRSPGEWPQTKDVTGSNYCDIRFHIDERTGRIVILSVIDNLMKGAAGQALQNLNIRMGWPETAGLTGSPLYP